MLIVALCASCASSKKSMVFGKKNPGYRRVQIEVPCAEYGFDNAKYFRGTGTATAVNQQAARRAALQNAKAMVTEKLGGFVQGLSTDYTRTVQGDAKASNVQGIIESEFATLVERKMNDVVQTCEKGFVLQDGLFEYWIAVEVSKQEIVDELTSRLESNKELEIEFNRDEFRKYAEDKMARMQDAE